MSVDTDLFTVFVCCFKVKVCYPCQLLGVECSEAVNDIEYVNRGLSEEVKSYFKVAFLSVTAEGIVEGFYICLRLVLLILLSSLLTFTTSPLKLTDAMEALLSPGKRVGVPAHELAMMMTIALRFVPTLIQETDRIMKAQQSRGADFMTGSIMKRMQAFVPVLVPLFLSAFRRADDLAMAMEARCYRGGEGRTQMKALKITSIDYVAWSFSILLIAAVLALR